MCDSAHTAHGQRSTPQRQTCSRPKAHSRGGSGMPAPAPPADEPIHRRAARYAWTLLLARIDDVFPLRCPKCEGEMRIITFITEATVVRELLRALGAPIAPPTIAPARGPPLWAAMDDAASDAAASDALPANTRAATARRGSGSRRRRPTARSLLASAPLPAPSTRKSASAPRGRGIVRARSLLDRHHQARNTRLVGLNFLSLRCAWTTVTISLISGNWPSAGCHVRSLTTSTEGQTTR